MNHVGEKRFDKTSVRNNSTVPGLGLLTCSVFNGFVIFAGVRLFPGS
jgi:hypothetical protein